MNPNVKAGSSMLSTKLNGQTLNPWAQLYFLLGFVGIVATLLPSSLTVIKAAMVVGCMAWGFEKMKALRREPDDLLPPYYEKFAKRMYLTMGAGCLTASFYPGIGLGLECVLIFLFAGLFTLTAKKHAINHGLQ